MLILVTVIIVDQVTKFIAKTNLDTAKSYLNDTFRLVYAENDGAFLSLGSSLDPTLRFWIFTVAVAAALIGLALYLIFSKTITTGHTIALSFILAGGIGNLIDRIVNGGFVIDFLNLGFGGIRTGIFNVADMAIVAGTLMLPILAFQESRESRQASVDSGKTDTTPPGT